MAVSDHWRTGLALSGSTIYQLDGQTIEVELHHFIRPEAKFDSLDALTTQMDRDCAEAKAILSAR